MISRITGCFERVKREGRSAFIPFIMAGDPSFEAAEALLNALPDAGADMVELGMPFSDPMADGPIIQAAGLRALEAGATTHTVLALAKSFRRRHPDTPLILMGYYNPIYVYGAERFASDAAAAGVDGMIIVDLPPEEEHELVPFLDAAGLALVRLITPTSLGSRLPRLLQSAKGYVYYISVTGVTGVKTADNDALKAQVARVKAATSLPVAVGFGIKTAAQVEEIGRFGDGVVVGSAIIAEIASKIHAPTDALVVHVTQYIRSLRGA
jgi:tryptophan synthase alpha chain